MPEPTTLPAAEFQALPLDFIVAAPLTAAIKAQAVAAAATRDFINAFIVNGQPEMVEFSFVQAVNGQEQKANIKAPLLAMVPVPHLRIDSLTVHFTYEISQTFRDTSQTDKSIALEAGTSGLLSHWVKASLKGSVASRSASESALNRSGHLEITLHASEAPMPEGLNRVLSLLARAVPNPNAENAPPVPPKPGPKP
jgi:hypothetical protein